VRRKVRSVFEQDVAHQLLGAKVIGERALQRTDASDEGGDIEVILRRLRIVRPECRADHRLRVGDQGEGRRTRRVQQILPREQGVAPFPVAGTTVQDDCHHRSASRILDE
jgi:hypothetical protein